MKLQKNLENSDRVLSISMEYIDSEPSPAEAEK
jgi:hypothetical protein